MIIYRNTSNPVIISLRTMDSYARPSGMILTSPALGKCMVRYNFVTWPAMTENSQSALFKANSLRIRCAGVGEVRSRLANTGIVEFS